MANRYVFNNTNHQGSANKKHNEISPHTYQNGYYQKEEITNPGEGVEKREPCSLLEIQAGTATTENGMEVPQNVKKIELPYGPQSHIWV